MNKPKKQTDSDSAQFMKLAPQCVSAILSLSFQRNPIPTPQSKLEEDLSDQIEERYKPFQAIQIPLSERPVLIGVVFAFLTERRISADDIDRLERWAARYTIETLLVPYFEYLDDNAIGSINASSPIRLVKLEPPSFVANFSTGEYHMVPRFPQGVINRSNLVAAELIKQLRKTAHIVLSDIAAETYDDDYSKSSAGTEFAMREEESVLSNFIETLEKKESAIELGCGTGRHSFELARIFDSVQAYDFSSRMISVAQHKKTRSTEKDLNNKPIKWKVEFGVRDIEMHPPAREENSVDLCAGLFGMGSFVEDLPAFIEEYASLLRPGGGMIMSFYNRDALVYSSPPPWRYPAISARLEIDREELIVSLPDGNIFRIFCKSYTPEYVKEVFQDHLSDVQVSSFPILSGFLPKDYVDSLQRGTSGWNTIRAIDEVLVHSDTPDVGNYLLVTGIKKEETFNHILEPGFANSLMADDGLLSSGGLAVREFSHERLRKGAEVAAKSDPALPYLHGVLAFRMTGRSEVPVVCLVMAGEKVSFEKLSRLTGQGSEYRLASKKEIAEIVGEELPPLPVAGYAPGVEVILDAKASTLDAFLSSCGRLDKSLEVIGTATSLQYSRILDITAS